MEEATLEAGQRVCLKDHFAECGTARCVGSLPGQTGTWVGVEWDNASRGKHSGEVGGIKVFDCQVPGAGSFIRPARIWTGTSLLQALNTKYKKADGPSGEPMFVLSVRRRAIMVELVGREQVLQQQGQLDALSGVFLPNAGISSPGDLHLLAKRVRELDISGNLFSMWRDIEDILHQLAGLEVLELSRNRIHWASVSPTDSFTHLRCLILNDAGSQWPTLVRLGNCLPRLDELHVCGNGIASLEVVASPEEADLSNTLVHSQKSAVEAFPCLRLLNLDNNKLQRWEQLAPLESLPCLEQLLLSNNELSNVRASSSEAFASLSRLIIGNNSITSWDSVNALDSFPKLKDVRLSGNPVADPARGGLHRYGLIARVGSLTALNGSEVSKQERKEAERRYVMEVMNNSLGVDGASQEHPRLAILKKVHQITDEDQRRTTTQPGKRMGDQLLSVTFVPRSGDLGAVPSVKKRLPPSTTVARLKRVVHGVLGIDVDEQTLHLKDESGGCDLSLTSDGAMLRELGIGSNFLIFIDTV